MVRGGYACLRGTTMGSFWPDSFVRACLCNVQSRRCGRITRRVLYAARATRAGARKHTLSCRISCRHKLCKQPPAKAAIHISSQCVSHLYIYARVHTGVARQGGRATRRHAAADAAGTPHHAMRHDATRDTRRTHAPTHPRKPVHEKTYSMAGISDAVFGGNTAPAIAAQIPRRGEQPAGRPGRCAYMCGVHAVAVAAQL